jgi:hypothetical protein
MLTSIHLVYVAEYTIAIRREKTNISDAQGRTVSQCDIPLSKVDSAILQKAKQKHNTIYGRHHNAQKHI